MSDRERLDVLHVASFDGNIGDNANHNGTRHELIKNIGYSFRFNNREIRKHYKNYNRSDELYFDDDFVREANNHDLLIIGGGGFFDIWIDSSASGTTIDLTKRQIDDIETPIVFHGLGCVPGPDVDIEIVDRFSSFLDHLFASPHCLVSVRNDGSVDRIRQTLGDKFAEKVREIPDGGFFVQVDDDVSGYYNKRNTVVGINVVSDMKSLRFPGGSNNITYDQFVECFSSFLNTLISSINDIEILFVPHIYSDFRAIYDILKEVDIFYRRNNVQVAPYLHGETKEKHIFGIYNQVDMSMGLRFHSNVCPIGLETPSIGLANGHPKVKCLYDTLGLSHQCVSVHNEGFVKKLLPLALEAIEEGKHISEKYRHLKYDLKNDLASFHYSIADLIQST